LLHVAHIPRYQYTGDTSTYTYGTSEHSYSITCVNMAPITDNNYHTFPILTSPPPRSAHPSISPFTVSTARGFLPVSDPLEALPPDFEVLESLLRRMPVKRFDGTPGLLAEGKLGVEVHEMLPDLSASIKEHAEDLRLMTALYRDYSFLASAYLLEPCMSPILA